ncbi:MAG: hypothetical protein LE168_01600 [Endomicrobium sp.]|nr:hypothetical protein [Endomicrobium sp.]
MNREPVDADVGKCKNDAEECSNKVEELQKNLKKRLDNARKCASMGKESKDDD